jgi:hypothetical protein
LREGADRFRRFIGNFAPTGDDPAVLDAAWTPAGPGFGCAIGAIIIGYFAWFGVIGQPATRRAGFGAFGGRPRIRATVIKTLQRFD